MEPVCYFIGRWEGQDFLYIAEVNTRELAEKVAKMTGLEILSDDDADPVAHFIRDYGTHGPDDTTHPLCPSADFGCPHFQWESGRCALEDPAHECDDYMYYNGVEDEND